MLNSPAPRIATSPNAGTIRPWSIPRIASLLDQGMLMRARRSSGQGRSSLDKDIRIPSRSRRGDGGRYDRRKACLRIMPGSSENGVSHFGSEQQVVLRAIVTRYRFYRSGMFYRGDIFYRSDIIRQVVRWRWIMSHFVECRTEFRDPRYWSSTDARP